MVALGVTSHSLGYMRPAPEEGIHSKCGPKTQEVLGFREARWTCCQTPFLIFMFLPIDQCGPQPWPENLPSAVGSDHHRLPAG